MTRRTRKVGTPLADVPVVPNVPRQRAPAVAADALPPPAPGNRTPGAVGAGPAPCTPGCAEPRKRRRRFVF